MTPNYICYVKDAITDGTKKILTDFVENDLDGKFDSVGDNREVYYCGEFGYWYTGKYHAPCETPTAIQDLLAAVRPHLSDKGSWINSCLITKYKDGTNHIPDHRDDEPFIDPESEIITVSIGETRTLHFVNNDGSDTKTLELVDRSVYTMTRYSQDHWMHGISPSTETDVGTRYSFTFRHISPHFLNSTAILGDSNTKYQILGAVK